MRHNPHNFRAAKSKYAGRILIILACFYGLLSDVSACCYDNSPSRNSSGGLKETPVSGSASASLETSDSDDETTSYEQTEDLSDSNNANSEGEFAGSSLSVLKRPGLKNMLVKKWRAEFARRDVFDAVTGQPLNVDNVAFYLQNIEENLALSSDKDFPVIDRDLNLLEEWINHALDERVPQKPLQKRLSLNLFRKSKIDAPVIINKLAVLELKHNMLVYGNNALQAMGVFIK